MEHKVNRGLRDVNGNGVVTGLTEVSKVKAKEKLADGSEVSCDGQLYYRGVNIRELVAGFMKDDRFGFEEAVYLLLFSELPNKKQLLRFEEELSNYRSLPTSFVRDIILKAPGKDMMNILSRSVLTLYAYDDNPDDISVANVLRQCLQLIAVFPLLSVYGYQSYQHYHMDKSLFIHLPKPGLSTAENILHLLREDGKYTKLEAKVLRPCACSSCRARRRKQFIHLQTHVVTSSGTDTYRRLQRRSVPLKGRATAVQISRLSKCLRI